MSSCTKEGMLEFCCFLYFPDDIFLNDILILIFNLRGCEVSTCLYENTRISSGFKFTMGLKIENIEISLGFKDEILICDEMQI